MRKIFSVAGLLIKEIFRKKDFYVALVFLILVLSYAAQMRFYNTSGSYRYLLDIGLGLGLFFSVFLTAALAARQFPSEIQNKTCQILLSKPISRLEVLLGKFAGSFIAGAFCLVIFFFTLIGFTLFRTQDLLWTTGFQTFYLFTLVLFILASISVLFSFFLTPAANTSIVFLLFMGITAYGSQLKKSLGYFYYAVPHFGFFDMRQRFIHGWGPLSWELLLFLTAYAFLYASLFIFIAWLLFRKKVIS